jgi:hypothetical protein
MIIISVIKSHKKSNLLIIKVKLHPHPLVPKRNDQERVSYSRRMFFFLKTGAFSFLERVPYISNPEQSRTHSVISKTFSFLNKS